VKDIKRIAALMIVLVCLAVLAGCASIQQAGNASYETAPVLDGAGKVVGQRVTIGDGKEFASRKIQFTSEGGKTTLTVEEGQSKSFKGQALAVKALTILPVNDLGAILAPPER
jgi:hypothetical protein